MNEQNLPFVSFGPADQNYNKRILPLLGNIDNGQLYSWYVFNLLRLLSWAVLIGGIVATIAMLFGDSGYIKTAISMDGLPSGKKIGSSIGLVIGLVLSLIAVWAMYSIMKKRVEQIKEIEYNGLLNYIFVGLFPRLITLMGELAFVLTLYIGLSQIFAALVGASVYAPLLGAGRFLFEVQGLGGMVPNSISGDYGAFADGLQAGCITALSSVIVLILFYIYKEVYNYALRLVMALITFLPKFAIPLAIRSKSE